MASLTGLSSGDFTDIDVLYTINIAGSAGSDGQVLSSDGTDTNWTDPHTLLDLEDLTAGTNITYDSGTTYDGSVARTINATNTTYTAGDGLDLTGTEFSADLKSGSGLTITSGEIDLSSIPNSALANSTISGVSLGSNLANLSAGTNVSFTYPGTYNGSSAITINTTDTNTTYAGGNNISIDTSANPDEIDLDPAITGMTGISYTGSGTTLTGGGGAGDETIATYLDLTSNTNLMPSLYPNNVKPYLVCDVYDPVSLDYDSLTTSYAQIFSGNLSNNFVAQTTSVLVELQIFNNQSSGNRWFYLRLSDGGGNEWSGGALVDGGGTGTGTRNTERLIHYADETDDQLMNHTWYLQGLSVGTTYTINPYTRTSSTYNYIYAGGSYPACILKVSNI